MKCIRSSVKKNPRSTVDNTRTSEKLKPLTIAQMFSDFPGNCSPTNKFYVVPVGLTFQPNLFYSKVIAQELDFPNLFAAQDMLISVNSNESKAEV